MAATVLVGGFGLTGWLSIPRGKRRTDRLARSGRPATALVVGARPCSIGEEAGTRVTLQISGLEVPEFEVPHRGPTPGPRGRRVPARRGGPLRRSVPDPAVARAQWWNQPANTAGQAASALYLMNRPVRPAVRNVDIRMSARPASTVVAMNGGSPTSELTP